MNKNIIFITALLCACEATINVDATGILDDLFPDAGLFDYEYDTGYFDSDSETVIDYDCRDVCNNVDELRCPELYGLRMAVSPELCFSICMDWAEASLLDVDCAATANDCALAVEECLI